MGLASRVRRILGAGMGVLWHSVIPVQGFWSLGCWGFRAFPFLRGVSGSLGFECLWGPRPPNSKTVNKP